MRKLYTSQLLRREGLDHGFTTRACGDVSESLDGWRRASGCEPERLLLLHQVHGADVVVLDAAGGQQFAAGPPPADASATALPGWVLGVRTADCLPILLYEPAAGVVAAVHAGWRGTLAGVAAAALAAMQQRLGCRPERVLAALGPSIRPCCYEVGDEVFLPFRERFGSQAVSLHGTSQRVDLQAANRLVLTECGVVAEHIEALDLCTCCSTEFFSHRRQGRLAGRQLAYLVRND